MINLLIGFVIAVDIWCIVFRLAHGHWPWRDHLDKKRLNAIEDGCCVSLQVEFKNKEWIYDWICIYEGDPVHGSTLREAIDNQLKRMEK